MGTKRKTTCGHFGGETAAGTPCKFKAGRGTDHPGEGACKDHNGSKEVLAFIPGIVQKPQNWHKAVASAFLWLVTGEIKGSAKGAGVGERTLQMWVISPWWGDACEEAKKNWLNSSMAWARKALMENLRNGDSQSARWLLERTDADLAPPKQRHEILVDYLHRDEVVRLMQELGGVVAEVVVEEEMRVEIVKRWRASVQPLTQEVFTPEGE